MKILCFLFALYIAALSVYPCYEDDCIEEVNIASSADHEDEEQEEAELCTPFCVSTCCAIHIFCTYPVAAVATSQYATIENSSYALGFTPLVVIPFWQPPKLA